MSGQGKIWQASQEENHIKRKEGVRMVHLSKTRRSNGARRWGNRLRLILLFATLMAIVIANNERILNRVRYFNKRYLNPWMLRRAEHHTVYYAVLSHVGRRSGQRYATPVVADFSADTASVLIPLPYGTQTDWCRNVLAAGRCTLSKNGSIYSLVEPQVLNATEALSQLPLHDRPRWRIFHSAHFLSARTEKPVEAEQPDEPNVRPVQAAS